MCIRKGSVTLYIKHALQLKEEVWKCLYYIDVSEGAKLESSGNPNYFQKAVVDINTNLNRPKP